MPRTQLLLAKKHFFPATRKPARREGLCPPRPWPSICFVFPFHRIFVLMQKDFLLQGEAGWGSLFL